jgi:proline iminopeptidase
MKVHTKGEGSLAIFVAPGGPGLTPRFYAELVEGLTRFGSVHTVAFSGTHPQPPESFPRTIEAGAEELADAISKYAMGRPAVVVGHSYGAAVTIELLCEKRYKLPEAAVLISGFPSGDFLAKCVSKRIEELPQAFHDRWPEAQGDPEASAELTQEFWFPKHLCRVPWPQSFQDGFAEINPKFLGHVLGPSIFEPTGTLRTWNRESCIAEPPVPILIAGGGHDYFTPDELRSFFGAGERSPEKVDFLFSDDASHSIWIEDPELFWSGLEDYISRFA